MCAEQITDGVDDLARRAARHAALGDVVRLRVVDLLSLGDATSSELGARVGVASNLLAHHLRILEQAGLISRHRSEGDRRRSYWRLDQAALASAPAGPATAPERLLFVCTANSARSHLAAALWRCCSDIPADSAGTQPADRIHPRAVEVARRRGLDLPEVAPQHVDDVAHDGDLVVTVCDRAHEELGPASQLHWSVPDPVAADDPVAFDAAYDELADRVRLLAPRLTPAAAAQETP